MNPLMYDPAVCRQHILMPYLFNMNQCPLPPAKTKMLDT